MIINARVLRVNPGSLLVREIGGNREILVNFRDARQFSVGDCVRIVTTGTMTFSIPPQVTALSIHRTQCGGTPPGPGPIPPSPPPGSRPAEMRAVVLQRQRGSLLVRDISNNRQVSVQTTHAHHFCPRQRIVITYDTMTMSNPPQIRALDITALC